MRWRGGSARWAIVHQSPQFCFLRVHDGLQMLRERGLQVTLGVERLEFGPLSLRERIVLAKQLRKFLPRLQIRLSLGLSDERRILDRAVDVDDDRSGVGGRGGARLRKKCLGGIHAPSGIDGRISHHRQKKLAGRDRGVGSGGVQGCLREQRLPARPALA